MPKKRTPEMIDTEIEFYSRKRRKAFKKMNRAAAEREHQAERYNKFHQKVVQLQNDKALLVNPPAQVPEAQ